MIRAKVAPGEFGGCDCPSHVHQVDCLCGCGGKPIIRPERCPICLGMSTHKLPCNECGGGK